MRAFTEPLHELSGFEEMTKEAQKTGLITISGCIDAQKSHMIYGIGNGRKNKVIVTFHEQKAKELYDDYRFFEPNTVYYPAKDILFYQSDIRGNLLTAERIRALRAIHEQQEVTVITTFDALMNTMAPPKTLWDSIRRIEPGDTVVLDELVARLVQMGYEKEYQVDTVGQFALRGGILDVYPLTEDNPVRIEMWGDEVDTIRSFDVESQKSIENLEELVIYPACELVLDDEEKQAGIARFLKEAKTFASKLKKEMKTEEAHRALSTAQELAEEWGELSVTAGMDAYLSYFSEERVGLLDYFDPADTYLFFDELSRCTERGKQTEVEFAESMKQRLEKGYILPGQMKELFGFKEVMGKIERYSCIAVSALDVKTNGLKSNGQYGIHVKSVNAYNNSFELLIKDLQHYKKNGYRIILLSGSRTRAERLAADIMNEGLNCFYTDDYDHELLPGQIMVCYGKVHKGYEYPILQFAVITETDTTEIAEAVQVMRSGTTSNAVYWFKTAMAKYPRQMERFFGSSYAAVSRLYYAMQGTLNVADDSELPTYDAKQLLKTYKKDGILIFTDEASALMTEGSMASELQAQLDKQKYGEDEDPQRVCAIGAVYGTWSNAGSFTPDDTETAWDADSLTEYLGSDALRGKDMLLALDGEDSPYLTENCLLKDTDTPVAEQVQKLFVLDKNNMASPESAESE